MKCGSAHVINFRAFRFYWMRHSWNALCLYFHRKTEQKGKSILLPFAFRFSPQNESDQGDPPDRFRFAAKTRL